MDQKLEKWERWLGAIHKEVIELITNQHIFWEIQGMIKRNPNIQKPNSFFRFIGQTYYDYGVIAVRRQIKCDAQSISFVRLLKEIVEIPCLLSRERFLSLYPADIRDEAPQIYDQWFRGEYTDHIDPIMVQKDIDDLRKQGAKLEEFADKRVAHYDKKAPKTIPTYNELDVAIDCLKKLTRKYVFLFEARDLGDDLVARFIVDHWDEIFSQPWIVDAARENM